MSGSENERNPCLTCGACCASFRVSFYWAEGDDTAGGTVPVNLTDRLGFHRRAMQGTNEKIPRCVALEGQMGICVNCSIYALRPSVCREFEFSWQNGVPNERCDQARALHGLPPLEPFYKELDNIENLKIESLGNS